MMGRALSRLSQAAWPFVALSFVVACTPDTSVRTAIVPLADGDYYGLNWGGTQIERFYALGRPGPPRDDNGSALLFSPENPKPCVLGDDVWDYSPGKPRSSAKYVLGSPSPTRIGLVSATDDENVFKLGFADIHCNRLELEMLLARGFRRSELYSPDYNQVKLAVFSGGTLTLADPWAGELREVTRNITSWAATDTELWLLEDGQVVRRDHDGRAIWRRGKNVSNFARLGDREDFMYSSDKGTFVVRAGKTKQLDSAAGACVDNSAEGFLPGTLAFYSPCAEGRLVVADEFTGKNYQYAARVGWREFMAGQLLFTTSTETETKLWLASSTAPEKFSEIYERERFRVSNLLSSRPGVLVFLVRLEESRQFEMWSMAIADPEHRISVVASGIVDFAFGDGGIAVLYENGDLLLHDRELAQVHLHVPNSLGTKFAFVFRGKASGLAYLSEYDPETQLGRLELHLSDGTHFALDDHVREFNEVWWPERGLVYVKAGDVPALNFARVDIPCETTSETAWACGF